MKKLLLLLPLGLFAVTGIYWISTNPKSESTHTVPLTETPPRSSQELFTYSERQVNAIIRNGEQQSITRLNQSLDLLSKNLTNYKHQGYETQELEKKFSMYQHDTALISSKLTTKLQQIHQYSQSEQEFKTIFLITMEQIGLYELKQSYNELDILRKNFIKKPTKEGKIAYEAEYKHLHDSITELYLDTKAEKPLLSYITNHKHYFDTITAVYDDIGYEQINRLHDNGYAIKAQLQLLPSS